MNASLPGLPLNLVTHEFSPMKGGIATFIEEMAGAAHQLRQDVAVWAPRVSSPFEHRFPYPVHRVAVRGTQDVSCQLRIVRELRRHRARLDDSALYLAEPGPMLALARFGRWSGFRARRLLLTFHGSEILRFAARASRRLPVSRLITAADRISTPSQFSRELLFHHFPEARDKTVITPGAPRTGFRERVAPRIRASGRIVILTVGRLHPRKGQLRVIEALDRLPADLAGQVEYWIVGRSVRGGYEGELRRRARHCRVPVTFFGNIEHDELEQMYGRADIFAMTSIEHGRSIEGFGIVYLEASSFGLPILGHAIGGVPEAVRHGETGLLVPPGDAAALTAALERMIRDAALRERLAANGRAWARRHSWQDSVRALLEGLLLPPPKSERLDVPSLQPA